MIVSYRPSWRGMIRQVARPVAVSLLFSFGVVLLYIRGYREGVFAVPGVSLSMFGAVLSIFLGFRTSSAYSRWWGSPNPLGRPCEPVAFVGPYGHFLPASIGSRDGLRRGIRTGDGAVADRLRPRASSSSEAGTFLRRNEVPPGTASTVMICWVRSMCAAAILHRTWDNGSATQAD